MMFDERLHCLNFLLRRCLSNRFNGNGYEMMYGLFLEPLKRMNAPRVLEIGLGCDMSYGPGASATLWRKYLPNAVLIEAEIDERCVKHHKKKLAALNIRAVTGSSGNPTVLRRWLQQLGGNFDAVIDDGSHNNNDMLTAFEQLWGAVKPGGFYFIEDMCIGRQALDGALQPQIGPVMADVLADWVEQKIIVSDSR